MPVPLPSLYDHTLDVSIANEVETRALQGSENQVRKSGRECIAKLVAGTKDAPWQDLSLGQR